MDPELKWLVQMSVLVLMLIITLGSISYNFFSPPEKDIPEDNIINLINLLPRVAALSSMNDTKVLF